VWVCVGSDAQEGAVVIWSWANIELDRPEGENTMSVYFVWIYVRGMHIHRATRLRLVTTTDRSMNQENGVDVVRSTFKAIFNQGIRTHHPNSVKIAVNLVRDFNLIQHFKQVLLSLAHSVRFISDKT
jgi:hypothetical protein